MYRINIECNLKEETIKKYPGMYVAILRESAYKAYSGFQHILSAPDFEGIMHRINIECRLSCNLRGRMFEIYKDGVRVANPLAN